MRVETSPLADALSRAAAAEAAAEGYRQQMERDRPIVQAARAYVVALDAQRRGEGSVIARALAHHDLCRAVAASPTTERTPQ